MSTKKTAPTIGAVCAKRLSKGGHGSATRVIRSVYQGWYPASRSVQTKTPPPVRRGGGCSNRLPVTRYDRGVTGHIAGGYKNVKTWCLYFGRYGHMSVLSWTVRPVCPMRPRRLSGRGGRRLFVQVYTLTYSQLPCAPPASKGPLGIPNTPNPLWVSTTPQHLQGITTPCNVTLAQAAPQV